MSEPGHRVDGEWMGEQVATLEDLLRPGLLAVCVGINPAPRSVAAGHYYQGPLGQRFYARLRTAGLLPDGDGWEDDRAFAAGVGFTDIVKRPTARAADVLPEEFLHGKPLLERKLEQARPVLLTFTFKATAEVLFGRLEGHAFVGHTFAGTEAFVMPGPYLKRELVAPALEALREAGQRCRERQGSAPN